MSSSQVRVLSALDSALAACPLLAPGARLLVAFSGGPDSLALLAGLVRLAPARHLELAAFHLDHDLDPGSRERAASAQRLAAALGVTCTVRRRSVAAERRGGESLEQTARRIRYAELEAQRAAIGATLTLTAHHLDDQVETLVLRLLAGSHWPGLAGIAPLHGRTLRPLLALRRTELHTALGEWTDGSADLDPLDDPTNDDRRVTRNHIRLVLLPHLAATEPDLVDAAAHLAATAARARRVLGRRLAPALDPRGMPLDWWLHLPPPVQREALRLVADRGTGGPGLRSTVWQEVRRQAARGKGARWCCDAGEGWSFVAANRRLRLERRPESSREFSYTVAVPGFVEIPEVKSRLRIRPVEPGESLTPRCSPGLVSTPLRPVDEAPEGAADWTVRSRKPGDRLRPEGAPGQRKLKDLLIDRKVPRAERALLPLLCHGTAIVWVPGVSVAAGWRPRPGEPAWVAEWERS